jgi:hypothetical protein
VKFVEKLVAYIPLQIIDSEQRSKLLFSDYIAIRFMLKNTCVALNKHLHISLSGFVCF